MTRSCILFFAVFLIGLIGCTDTNGGCWPGLRDALPSLNSAYYGVATDSARDHELVRSAKRRLSDQLSSCSEKDDFVMPESEVAFGLDTRITLLDVALMADDAGQTVQMVRRFEEEAGLGPTVGGIVSKETALHLASFFESAHSVRVLLELGFDPDAIDDDGMTALHHASAFSSSGIEVIARLVQGGANLESTLGDSITPMVAAYLRGDLGKAQCLFNLGATVPPAEQLREFSVPQSRQDDVNAVRLFFESEEKLIGPGIRNRCIKSQDSLLQNQASK